MERNKQKALELLKQKINGEKITYNEISNRTGYEKRQLIRLSKEIKKRDINSMLVHGLTNKPSNHSAPQLEIRVVRKLS